MKLSTVLLLFALSFVCAAANGKCSSGAGKSYTNCMKTAGSTSPNADTAACRTALEDKLNTCRTKPYKNFEVKGVILKAIQSLNN